MYWIAWTAALLFLLIGAVMDLKTRELPAYFLFGFAAAGIAGNLLVRYQPFTSVAAGCLAGGLMLLLGRISGEAIGYGDGLGILVLGIFLGGKRTVLIVTIAFLLSALYGSFLLLSRHGRAGDRMPFFPCLLLAALGGMFLL